MERGVSWDFSEKDFRDEVDEEKVPAEQASFSSQPSLTRGQKGRFLIEGLTTSLIENVKQDQEEVPKRKGRFEVSSNKAPNAAAANVVENGRRGRFEVSAEVEMSERTEARGHVRFASISSEIPSITTTEEPEESIEEKLEMMLRVNAEQNAMLQKVLGSLTDNNIASDHVRDYEQPSILGAIRNLESQILKRTVIKEQRN